MLRHTTVTILLATSVTLVAACGGGSKSTDTATTPTAATAEEPPMGTTHESEIAGTEARTEEERQNVAGATGTTGTTGTSGMPSDPSAPSATGTEMGASTQLQPAAIFALLKASNEHEVAVSKLAVEKSKNSSVKKYARMIVDEHTKMLNNAEKMSGQLASGVSPEPNDQLERLKSDSQSSLEQLRGLKGAEFDRAYIDQMVQDHEKTLSLIDEQIQPAAAGNSDIISMLDSDRPKIQKHLEDARKLQTQLNK